MQFNLDESQLEKLSDWKNEIKNLFGEYGKYDYIFTPCGIGTIIKVYSHLKKENLDLSDIDRW
jgi:hypothetical protein